MKKVLKRLYIHPKGIRTLYCFLLTGVLLSLCAPYPVSGQDDLLLLPAIKSDRAAFSMLTDVVRTNCSLVAVGERGHVLLQDIKEGIWRQADVSVRVNLTAVAFPTDRIGWAVGHDGVILHSDDGGVSWKKQIDGKEINKMMLIQLNKMIADKKKFIVDNASNLNSEEMDNLNFELEDLGYFLKDLKLVEKEGPTRPLLDVWFKNVREGIAVGSYGMILKTEDGGENWVSLMDRMENAQGYHYYGITRCGDDLFIAGEYGMLFRSSDFGNSWKKLSSPYEGSFFGIVSKPEGGLIAAFGLRGTVFYTYDRGDTWVAANTGTMASISGGTTLSDGSICLVATDGSILVSSDGAKNFFQLSTRFPGSISVATINKDLLVVVGLRGIKQIDININCPIHRG